MQINSHTCKDNSDCIIKTRASAGTSPMIQPITFRVEEATWSHGRHQQSPQTNHLTTTTFATAFTTTMDCRSYQEREMRGKSASGIIFGSRKIRTILLVNDPLWYVTTYWTSRFRLPSHENQELEEASKASSSMNTIRCILCPTWWRSLPHTESRFLKVGNSHSTWEKRQTVLLWTKHFFWEIIYASDCLEL